MDASAQEPQSNRSRSKLEGIFLLASQAHAASRRMFRRLSGKPRTVAESPNLLPTLIKVFAAFARVDGEILEEEIDSSLGFLRYDYPDAVYSELRKLFRDALHEQQDLNAIAQKLSAELDDERKILLGVQLYDLISKAGLKQEQVIAYYSFMSQLGMAAQAIDIVYQLNANEQGDAGIYHQGASPLEAVSFGPQGSCDVALRGFQDHERILAYRYKELVILKNLSGRNLIVQGRVLKNGDLCRIFTGQRILIDDQVITHQDLVFYFNAKKNVATPQIFVAVNEDDEVRLEKNQSRDSCLQVTFGLGVKVTALKDVDAVLRDVRLTQGRTVDATLEDNIIFHNDSELDLGDLRRRARQYGGRFQLKASKSEYLVSNNPGLLHEDDILLSAGTGGDVLLKIYCDYDRKEGRVEVLQADRPIVVRGVPVRNYATLADGDTIRIDAGQVLRCNFTERLIEEERNIVRNLEVRDLVCRFRNSQVALDGISFSVQRGEMVCVMGASGAGKSTLMRSLSGTFAPAQGDVLFNGRSLYSNNDQLRKYVTYIPQHDAFDEHLTIEENLNFAAALRAPHLSRRERLRRIDSKLAELGLNERRNYVVGAAHKKTLSGGERKRLNIGLDMIGSADVYLFDEPTSGLSSKDSEHVIEIIRGMSHNKIVLVTIHQPTSKIFQMFNKAVLLDRGGKLVFFGTPQEMLKYFAEAEHQQHFGTEMGTCEACGTTRPEFIFDVLETPLRDLSGDIIFEENNRGQLVPARRYSPDYWRDKYEAYRLMKDVQQTTPPKDASPQLPSTSARRREPIRWREEWRQFVVLLKRAFLSKMRMPANLLMTILVAPALALLIGFVLRYNESGPYDFSSAYHIPTYLFLSLVVAMFLGLTNSVDDILRDRPVLLRERNLNVRIGYYVAGKALTLSVFALVQCALYTWIGDALLSVRGVYWIVFVAMFLTTVSGVAIGLVISSLVNESKTAVLVIPAVLIPQIILAGALIKYEEMNRNLDFVYTIEQWANRHPDAMSSTRSDLQVPLICEFMPMRWSYEALVFAQAKLNPLTSRQEIIQKQITELAANKNLTEPQEDRLEDLKDLLAIVSGLQGKNAKDIDRKLREVDNVIRGGPLDRAKFRGREKGVTAEQIYINQKVTDLISKAEMEQTDYRNDMPGRRHLNVFFGPVKEYLGIKVNMIWFNIGVLTLSTLVLFFALFLILNHQIRTRTV
ncbi:ABC-type multidrug transport system, ATPase component [Terrimicrobium sacchariphilum]|uniref:ABC-type multidrug transport system, ATPase component n=1 Tax=Terrimicrobium sacchariphilum TaxID=690879 RepID=A0A146G9S0_TERSA|nr:ATP-binding cassette domain-containing protein [Terrimicrobium sacchariphilum]GAT33398.1 ABC-type multidrug transport system, ATPase component [Terrimicrobium sacchariphilum]